MNQAIARISKRQVDLRQQIGQTLALVGRDVLAFHPKLTQVTGSITAGLMLSQSIYWTRTLIERSDREGWFWKTIEDWQHEIALSKHEQITARKRLATLPFWQEARRATHGRMHYRVDVDVLARHLDAEFTGQWVWGDRQQMLTLLGRPVLVFRPVADVCKSVTAAILLSHFIGVERQELRSGTGMSETHPRKGWHVYQFEHLKQQTGLSRHELTHARATLRDRGYLKEKHVGAPQRAHWMLDLNPLIHDLQSKAASKTGNTSDTQKPNSQAIFRKTENTPVNTQKQSETRVVDQYASFQQSSMLETSILLNSLDYPKSGKQIIRNPENMFPGNRTICFPETGNPNIRLTTGKPTTTTPPSVTSTVTVDVKAPRGIQQSGGGGLHVVDEKPKSIDVVWPTMMLPDECTLASSLLASVAPKAQLILDEMAGQHALTPIRQPLAYLRKLTAQAIAGQFVPSVAPRVAEQRKRLMERKAVLQREQQEKNLQQSGPTIAEQSSDQRESARRRLATMQALMGRRAAESHMENMGHVRDENLKNLKH